MESKQNMPTNGYRFGNGVKIKCGVLFVGALYALTNFFALAYMLILKFLVQDEKERRLKNAKMLKLSLSLLFLKIAPRIGEYKIDGVIGVEKYSSTQRTIFIANHTSLLDPILMLSILPNTGVLLKKKYQNWLAIRFLVKNKTFVSLESQSPKDALKAENSCLNVLNDNRNLLIFPEGKRSPTGKPANFQKLAFVLSKKAEVDIVPVSIIYSHPVFSKRQKGIFPVKSPSISIEFHDALKPKNYKSAAQMLAEAQSLIDSDIKKKFKPDNWK